MWRCVVGCGMCGGVWMSVDECGGVWRGPRDMRMRRVQQHACFVHKRHKCVPASLRAHPRDPRAVLQSAYAQARACAEGRVLAERARLAHPLGEGLQRTPERGGVVVRRVPPQRLKHLLLHERHWHQLRKPHHQRRDEVVAGALGTGDEVETRPVLRRVPILLRHHSRVWPPERVVQRCLNGRAPLDEFEEGLLRFRIRDGVRWDAGRHRGAHIHRSARSTRRRAWWVATIIGRKHAMLQQDARECSS